MTATIPSFLPFPAFVSFAFPFLSLSHSHSSAPQVDARSSRPGYEEWTPLHLAAARGYTEILQVLLTAKAGRKELMCSGYTLSLSLNMYIY